MSCLVGGCLRVVAGVEVDHLLESPSASVVVRDCCFEAMGICKLYDLEDVPKHRGDVEDIDGHVREEHGALVAEEVGEVLEGLALREVFLGFVRVCAVTLR